MNQFTFCVSCRNKTSKIYDLKVDFQSEKYACKTPGNKVMSSKEQENKPEI